MRVYTKLERIESVFNTDVYVDVDVGADENNEESLMAEGVSESMYE